ncbi:SEC-C metal-binding domain-containing protein [Oceanobacillus rekensis]|uniref:SEC-C metal-binding domain-containing protein n=1 Tax=Oceanobacillus rekensis TaxID=937927 RepID=UPI000B4430BF|nr:SEC-C metal-binding domain-containing protein [Oceanobacillus rekensis]
MNDKNNKEVEKAMQKAIAGLKDLSRDMESKAHKKHWNEIKVPFSLHEGLSKYTKYELEDIRKKLQIKNASSLKKADLILLLQQRIPEYLEKIYHLWGSERFKLVMKIASNGGYITAPDLTIDQINYFRGNGLIYTGTLEGKKVWAVPEELIESILAMKSNVLIRGILNRNTEWIKLTRGLLFYYGTLSSIQLVEMLESYTKETIPFGEFLDVIYDVNIYRKEINLDLDSFSDSSVFDSKRVKQEHQIRKRVPFYPFTKQQLLLAGEPGFVDRNHSYVQLMDFLTENFEIDREEADSFVEDCVYATRIGDSPNDVMKLLSDSFDLGSIDMLQASMDKVVQLVNNTRQWFLKGNTPRELGEQERKHLQPLPAPEAISKNEKVEKIGRNEPCLCGSGKKYKKCCGR